MPIFKSSFLHIEQGGRRFLLTKLPASVVTSISYAAIRGKSSEAGAVQRVLNSSRINSIKNFTLQGGDYPNSIVLNWVNTKNPLLQNKDTLSFEIEAGSAQIIDGQHRVAGIRSAIEDQPSLNTLELPVVFYENLTTKECADIFLSINTEQKPVPRSLVFDLYGIASEGIVDIAAVRARDIAMFLNSESGSPYEDDIKMPGAPTRRGGIALSTAVSAIKPLVEDKGAFEQISVNELETQRQVILNLFKALQAKYGPAWNSKNNVFLYAAGFMSALDFLKLKLIPYCIKLESFSTKTISSALNLEEGNLIYQDEVKGLGGVGAQKRIYELLVEAFQPISDGARKTFEI